MSAESWITRKVMSPCGHSVPILIPCTDCVRNTLERWEDGIRKECAKQASERYHEIEETSVKDADTLRQANRKLTNTIATLQSENAGLRVSLKDATESIDNMRAQLHADSAVRTLKKIVDNTAKAAEQ